MIKTGDKNFWIAQTLGWGTMAFSNLVVQFIAGVAPEYLISNAVAPFICGFIVTSLYRQGIKAFDWSHWSLRQVIGLILASTLLLSTVFLASVFIMTKLLFGLKTGMGIVVILNNFVVFSLIMLLWNLIYFWIHYFNNWNKAEIEKWQLAAEMKDAQLGSLKSQINPHFVFNALNNIRALILENPDKARDMLLNFSDLFRYSLKHSDQATVALEEELEVVNQYLELLSIQYEDKLSYHVDVSPNLSYIRIPPMVLQLLVENAVKHGISQKKEGGEINIEIQERLDFLNIIVKNSGKLLTSPKLGEKLGVGLENIRKRLALIYNGEANLNIFEENEYVVAYIKIPLL